MKNANTASKKAGFSRLFKTILSLVMVFSILVGCSLMFVGCSDADDGKSKNPASSTSNRNDPAQYEGLEGAAYLQKLEANSLGSLVDTLGEAYGTALKNMNTNITGVAASSKMDVTLNLSDDVLDMVSERVLGGADLDLSFLSKINLSMDVSIKDQMEKMQMILGLNGQDIITLNVLMDMADYVMYMAAPDLSNTYLRFDISDMMGGNAIALPGNYMEIVEQIANILPDADLLTSVLNRYLEIALAELDNVEQAVTTLNANGITQECTDLTLKIYEEDALNAVKAVLKAAKNDKDLKKIIEDAAETLGDMMGQNISASEAYDAFKTAIDSALSSLDNVPTDTETYIEWVTYVDDNHNIIGRELSMHEYGYSEILFYYYTATSGEDFGFVAAVPGDNNYYGEDFKISGTGTKKDGKTSGAFTVYAEGTDYVVVTLENVTAESGAITIAPTARIEKELGLDEIPFKKLALQIEYSSSGVALNILSQNKTLVGIELKATPSNGPSLSVPSNSIDATSSSAMNNWANNIKLDTVLSNLRKAGVPSELVDMLESMI